MSLSHIEVEIKITAVDERNTPIKTECHFMTGTKDAIAEFLLVNHKRFPEYASRAKRMLDSLHDSPDAPAPETNC